MARTRIGSADLGNPPEIVPYDPVMPRWFHTGLNGFLLGAGCDIAGAMESGYRAIGADGLANWVAVSRSRGGCYPGNPPPLNRPSIPPPFEGGQCPTTYIATVDRRFQNNPSSVYTSVSPHVIGPVAEVRPIPGGSGSYSVEYRREGESTFQPVPGGGSVSPINPILSINSISFQRLDGQPDDCGNLPTERGPYPPGQDLPPAPTPGTPFRPDEDFDFDFPDGNGNNIPITVPIVNFNFNPDIGVNFNFGGVDVNVSPDFGIDIGSDNGTTPADLAPIGNDIADIKNDTERSRDELEQAFAGTLSYTDCNQNDLVTSYSGTGIAAILQAIQAQTALLNQGQQQFCPLPPTDPVNVDRALLLRETLTLQTQIGSAIQVPAKANLIEVIIESGGLDEYTHLGITQNNRTGRYGWFYWGLLTSGGISWSTPQFQWFERSVFEVPRDLRGDIFCRFSGRVGTTYAIYDTGFRFIEEN